MKIIYSFFLAIVKQRRGKENSWCEIRIRRKHFKAKQAQNFKRYIKKKFKKIKTELKEDNEK